MTYDGDGDGHGQTAGPPLGDADASNAAQITSPECKWLYWFPNMVFVLGLKILLQVNVLDGASTKSR